MEYARNDSEYYERNFYGIELDEDGSKLVRYYGYTFERCEPVDGLSHSTMDFTHAYAYIEDAVADGLLSVSLNAMETYYEDVTRETLDETFGDWPGRHLAFADVTTDTPCGDYWCYDGEL